MTDHLTAADPYRDWKPISALPNEPLTDEQLRPLLDNEKIKEIWVPVGRPANVTSTTRGGHEGDILTLFIEFEGRYVRANYTKTTAGPYAWFTPAEPIPKHPDEGGDDEDPAFEVALLGFIESEIDDDFEPLSEKGGGAGE